MPSRGAAQRPEKALMTMPAALSMGLAACLSLAACAAPDSGAIVGGEQAVIRQSPPANQAAPANPSMTQSGSAAPQPSGQTQSGSETQVAAVDFASWRAALRADALQAGISPAVFDGAMRGVAPIPRVIELDRRQPEGVLSFDDYRQRVIPAQRVANARQRLAENRAELAQAEQRFGVPARFIVSLWAIESDFGRNMGSFSVIGALATLAYDGRRSAYFRRELLDALTILQRGDVSADAMRGSWAGAMGQSQFMPSSFLRYAVDANGDGRRDIWSSRSDVFASIANYLSTVGWVASVDWGREATVPDSLDPALISLDVRKSLAEWRALGVQPILVGGRAFRDGGQPLSLVRPNRTGGGPVYLVTNNYRTIMNWNRSFYFATSVGLLSDQLFEG